MMGQTYSIGNIVGGNRSGNKEVVLVTSLTISGFKYKKRIKEELNDRSEGLKSRS